MERVLVKNVSKKFHIGFKKKQGVLGKVLSLLSDKETKKIMWGLKNVSFSVRSGEMIGIIGRNGSGKSTLLRVIAGIYRADEGTVSTTGNIISLIGLGSGLKDRLTLKDNIYLLCALYGLDHKQVIKRFHTIIEFSELEKFTDTKIYQLSDGMRQRLAFSIAIHCNPEILILDEVFAVGDKNFRIKSLSIMKSLLRQGVAILLTSHDLSTIENQLGRTCDRVLWLDKGKIVEYGDSKRIMENYLKNGKITRKLVK